jgi:hypothetical protein
MSIENDIDNLSKWLNEGIVSDIDRKALARVLGHLRYAPKQEPIAWVEYETGNHTKSNRTKLQPVPKKDKP